MVADTATWGTERIVAAKPTQTVSLSGCEFSFDGLVQRPGPNYNAFVAKFIVRSGGVLIGIMEPSTRSFSARGMAALMSSGVGPLYLSLGDSNNDGSIAVRHYYKPMVLLIWLGAPPQYPKVAKFGLRGKMDKCTFCAGGPDADGSKEEFEKYGANRLAEGKLPLCGEMCWTKSLLAGDSDVIAQIYNVRVSKRGYGFGAWGWQTAYRDSIAT